MCFGLVIISYMYFSQEQVKPFLYNSKIEPYSHVMLIFIIIVI